MHRIAPSSLREGRKRSGTTSVPTEPGMECPGNASVLPSVLHSCILQWREHYGT